MVNNYIKVLTGRSPHHFFPFDDTQDKSFAQAILRASRVSQRLTVWRRFEGLPCGFAIVGESSLTAANGVHETNGVS